MEGEGGINGCSALAFLLTIFANYVMDSPVSPGIESDFTVLEECRGTTFIALQDAQKKNI